jgi:hypothetical protein
MTAWKIQKTQDRSVALDRARELAATGRHINYLTIETQLWNEGHFQARIWLDDIALRGELKQLCDHSRQELVAVLPSNGR